MRLVISVCVLAACGDNAHLAAPVDAAAPICTATFTGNLDDMSRSAADCATITIGADGVVLGFSVPSAVLGTTLGVSIALGDNPTPGAYSSETTTSWSALAIRDVPTGACVLTAGAATTPTGSFTLALPTLDPFADVAHGTLAIDLAVLAETTEQGAQTDCGAGASEHVAIAF